MKIFGAILGHRHASRVRLNLPGSHRNVDVRTDPQHAGTRSNHRCAGGILPHGPVRYSTTRTGPANPVWPPATIPSFLSYEKRISYVHGNLWIATALP